MSTLTMDSISNQDIKFLDNSSDCQIRNVIISEKLRCASFIVHSSDEAIADSSSSDRSPTSEELLLEFSSNL